MPHRTSAATPLPPTPLAQLLPMVVHALSRSQSIFKPDKDDKDTKPDSKKVGRGPGGSVD